LASMVAPQADTSIAMRCAWMASCRPVTAHERRLSCSRFATSACLHTPPHTLQLNLLALLCPPAAHQAAHGAAALTLARHSSGGGGGGGAPRVQRRRQRHEHR
jgi:hypothetical protein